MRSGATRAGVQVALVTCRVRAASLMSDLDGVVTGYPGTTSQALGHFSEALLTYWCAWIRNCLVGSFGYQVYIHTLLLSVLTGPWGGAQPPGAQPADAVPWIRVQGA
jgi:hypothetical protein